MTANWLSGTRWQHPKGYGDVEPMLAQTARESATPALDAEYQHRVTQMCERMKRDVKRAYGR